MKSQAQYWTQFIVSIHHLIIGFHPPNVTSSQTNQLNNPLKSHEESIENWIERVAQRAKRFQKKENDVMTCWHCNEVISLSRIETFSHFVYVIMECQSQWKRQNKHVNMMEKSIHVSWPLRDTNLYTHMMWVVNTSRHRQRPSSLEWHIIGRYEWSQNEGLACNQIKNKRQIVEHNRLTEMHTLTATLNAVLQTCMSACLL